MKQIIKRIVLLHSSRRKNCSSNIQSSTSCWGNDFSTSEKLADEVVKIAELQYPDGIAEVEGIQDIVEKY